MRYALCALALAASLLAGFGGTSRVGSLAFHPQ